MKKALHEIILKIVMEESIMSSKCLRSKINGSSPQEDHLRLECFSRKKAGLEPPYIDPGKQFLDQISRLPKMLSTPPTVAEKFERKFETNWYALCNQISPFTDPQPTYIDPTVIAPWLKQGDAVLVTGYNRNCGFIEKLCDSMLSGENFFGNSNQQLQKDFVNWQDERLFQRSVRVRIAAINNLPLAPILPGYKQRINDFASRIKKAKNILICSFKDDCDFLRNMNCWDSVIEIRRGKKVESPCGRYTLSNVKFLRARHMPEELKCLTYKMITYIPDGTTGYDATKKFYFVNIGTGYEELKDRIVRLFMLGRTADEIKMILENEDKIIISLPMLNKLKLEWGLRTYKLERKPRKPKRTKKRSSR